MIVTYFRGFLIRCDFFSLVVMYNRLRLPVLQTIQLVHANPPLSIFDQSLLFM